MVAGRHGDFMTMSVSLARQLGMFGCGLNLVVDVVGGCFQGMTCKCRPSPAPDEIGGLLELGGLHNVPLIVKIPSCTSRQPL